VTFGAAGNRQPVAAPAPVEKTVVSTQGTHVRDGGVVFGNAQSPRPAGVPALRKEEVTQWERSHDAGITFGNTERGKESKAPAVQEDGGIWTMFESMIRLGKATAKFSFDQIRSGFCMLTDPVKGLRRVQHSIDNVARAMNEPVEDAPAHPEP